MSSEDYLIRQFRQLAQVIARMIGLQEKNKFNEALTEIDQTFNTWFNTNPDNFEEHEEEWNAFFDHPSNHYETEKIVAELLYQRTILLAQLKMSDKTNKSAKASLFFFRKIDELSGEFSTEIQERIAQLEEITTHENH